MSENYKVSEWKRASLNHASDKRLVELTEAELQCIVNLFKDKIGLAQKRISFRKDDCTMLYELCNPEDNLTQGCFKQLNMRRDALRYWKAINKKLSAIQAKLKRAR